MYNKAIVSFNERLDHWWMHWLLAVGEFVLASSLLVITHTCVPFTGPRHMTTTLVVGWLVIVPYRYRTHSPSVNPWSVYKKVEGRSCNTEPHKPHIVNYPGVVSSKPAAAQRDGAIIRRVTPRVVRRHPGTETTYLIHASIAFSTVTPVVIRPCAEMEFLAIQNRVTRAVNPPSPQAVDLFFTVLNMPPFLLLTGGEIPYSKGTYEEWNRRFPRVVAERHDAVRRLLTDHSRPIRMTSVASSFIKVEKVSFASTPGGVDDPTPRLIQGQTDKLNVVQGPWFYQFSKLLKRVWDGSQCLFYTSGQNADTLGDWFFKQHAKFEDVGYVLIDYTKFDSTVNKPCYDLALEVYRLLGMQAHPQVWAATKMDERQKGYTRFGYYYETDYGTGSGKADTSVKNSMINAALAMMTLTDTSKFKMCVMGDDSLIIGDSVYLEGLVDTLVANARALGFEPKARFTRQLSEVDYCSKVPYPALHPVTREPTIVFGPKIGKLLHKIGGTCRWLVSNPNNRRCVSYCNLWLMCLSCRITPGGLMTCSTTGTSNASMILGIGQPVAPML